MPNPLSYITMIIPVLAASINEPSIISAEPAWKAEPTGRGSLSIILNCLVTLLLCVWTTTHINFVPNMPGWLECLINLVYVVAAMLAPEMMLGMAGIEWIKARELREKWCEAKNVKPGSKEDTFGMAGAYLVCMGGVAIFPTLVLPNLPTIVTDEGVSRLLLDDPRNLSDMIERRAASQKTKTDALGKTIVCVQGMWMVVQCISRKATGLPVTLLELHVALHVICALIIHIFWWDKPQNITEPLILLHDIADAVIFALGSAEYKLELDRLEGGNIRYVHKTMTDPIQIK